MSPSTDFPDDIEPIPAQEGREAADTLKETATVELFRLGRIDHSELAAALSVSRNDADAVLKRHGVLLETSVQEVLEDVEALRKLRRS